MTSNGQNRPNRWPRSPVTWIGGVALLGLVVVGVFGIRSLVVSSGEGTTGSGEGAAPAARAEKERAEVEGDESPVDSADGIAPGDRPDEEINDPPVPPEEAAESSGLGPPEAEEPGEPPTPVTTTPEPSADDLAEESGKFDVGRPVIGEPYGSAGSGWIVSWNDGLLEVGWPKISGSLYDENIYDESRLIGRTLSDNQHCRSIRPLNRLARIHNCWEGLEHHLIPNEGESIRAIISDGERLIAASETDEQVYVSVTSDLVNWDTTEIVLSHPPRLPDFVYTISYIDHLAIGPSGWLLKVTTEFTIDILVHAGIREPRTGLSIYDLRDELNAIGTVSENENGIEIIRKIDEEVSGYTTQTFYTARTLSWDELGFDLDMFRRYYSPYRNKPYVFSEHTTGSVWVAAWGEDPVWVDLPEMPGLPDLNGTCCDVVGTEAGYLAFSDPSEPGYDPTWWGPGVVFFSSDGHIWISIESPSAVFFNVWPVEIGLIVSGALLEAYEDNGHMEWTSWDWDRPFFWWSVNPDGSNWQEIKMPSYIPMRSPFEMLGYNNPTIRLAMTE